MPQMLSARTSRLEPIVVNLDGALLRTDLLLESTLRLLRDRPMEVLKIPLWLPEGRNALRRRLAALAQLDPRSLPYNEALLDWLRQQKAQGRRTILCSTTDPALAVSVAAFLELFDEVVTDEGAAGGNVGSENLEGVFPVDRAGLTVWLRALRVHQWLKNLLLFVPIFAAHQLTNLAIWRSLSCAFLSFSLCASSVYIANDLLDLENDRRHLRKRRRPFACGQLSISTGIVSACVLLCASLLVAAFVGGTFMPALLCYFLLTCAYSCWLKRLTLVDCLTLAMLYTLRILAGAAAAKLAMSFWLLAFSVFLFLSLAFVKRYAEMEVRSLLVETRIQGRGYYASDAPLIQNLGVTSGYGAVLVLALYLNSDAVVKLYRTPGVIWGTVPIMLFWLNWIWMQAHRGRMHDDPLVFAITDKASLLCGVAFAAVLSIAALGWPW